MQVTTIILIFLSVWLAILTYVFYTFTAFLGKLAKNTKGGSYKQILSSILEVQNSNKTKIEDVGKELSRLNEKSSYHVQKMGIVRFNPFNDMGGDQSFSLALLDGKNSGIVITGLHTRERTRLYIKTIKTGKCEHDLSAEEKKALASAMKNQN